MVEGAVLHHEKNDMLDVLERGRIDGTRQGKKGQHVNHY